MSKFGILASVVALLTVVADAKPPETDGYARYNELRARLAARARRVQAEEEFKAKPIQEKYLIMYSRKAETFEGFKLTGENVVNEILFKWDDVQKPTKELSEAHLKVLEDMPNILAARYQTLKFDKKDRYNTARPLVKALQADRQHIRRAAINCLKRIYSNEGLFYQPDLPPNGRKDKARDWLRYIKKRR